MSRSILDAHAPTVVERRRRGVSLRKLGAQFHVSQTTVKRLLDVHDIDRPPLVPIDEARRLYVEQRWSMGRLAARYGVATTTVRTALLRAKVALRGPGRYRKNPEETDV